MSVFCLFFSSNLVLCNLLKREKKIPIEKIKVIKDKFIDEQPVNEKYERKGEKKTKKMNLTRLYV